jgi:hypothetical protein
MGSLVPILNELIELELIVRRDTELLFVWWNCLFDERHLLDPPDRGRGPHSTVRTNIS